ncbi:wax ester/triacylglycerol synthase domain-containing protein [Streptosporangium sp. NPDC023825]|uniref:wax ester/triacylglycerol synthase domain-containing protein n=1 Tax=Streptosporangium sp. NPDC023825 TaxID=3154909 RepID=UPI00341D8E38
MTGTDGKTGTEERALADPPAVPPPGRRPHRVADRVRTHLVNPLVRLLLRSPWHALISRWVVLLAITGRRSGATVVVPAQYAHDGQGLMLVSKRSRVWWRNLEGGASLRLTLRGIERAGRADVSRDPERVRAALLAVGRAIGRDEPIMPVEEAVAVTVRLDPLDLGETMTGPRQVIERTGPTDLAMLAMGACGPVPQQMGALLVLATHPGFDPAAARELLAQRIRSVPRLRQRLLRVPPGCGRPVWVDDPAFDIGSHVRSVLCPAPGNERALLDTATAVVCERLPGDRPLWAAVFVTGLADGATGLVMVVDHVLADGIGGLAVLAELVDETATPAQTATSASFAFPRRPPSLSALAVDALRGRLRARPRVSLVWRAARMVASAGDELHPVAAARCSLLRPTGPRRRVEVVRADLAELRAAAHRCGGTVNDALLTAITGALRALLAHRGEAADTLTVGIMVGGRRVAATDRLGNEARPLVVTLPAAGDPPGRLEKVATILAARKERMSGPPVIALLTPLLRGAIRLGLYRWFMRRQRRIHTLVSNVRGPDRPLTFAGAAIRALVPLAVSESGNIPVSFDILSYAGTLTIALIADPDHIPDLPVLVAALRTELADLGAHHPLPESQGPASVAGPAA